MVCGCTGAADDTARCGPVLRRHGAAQERAGYAAAVLGTACVVSVVWFAVGYSLAFTPGSAWIGGLDYQLLTQQVAINPIAPRIPEAAYAIFQMTFAIITAALIVGALVERMRFGALMLFMLLWSLFVYVPVAHWVWEPNG